MFMVDFHVSSSSTVICCEFSDDFELISNKKKENSAHEVLFNDFDSFSHLIVIKLPLSHPSRLLPHFLLL